MLYNEDYTDCKVIVRDERTKNVIGQATVLDCNKARLSIFVEARLFTENIGHRLSVLIIGDTFIHEFGGMARKTSKDSVIEISMFSGKEKEERIAQRHQVGINAIAMNIKDPASESVRENHLEVKMVDISSTGVQIEASPVDFQVGAIFNLKLNIAGSDVIILSEIVRNTFVTSKISHYGCKFIAVK